MVLALLGNDGTNLRRGARVDVTGSCGFGEEELARGGRVQLVGVNTSSWPAQSFVGAITPVAIKDQNPRPVSPKNGETRTGHPRKNFGISTTFLASRFT